MRRLARGLRQQTRDTLRHQGVDLPFRRAPLDGADQLGAGLLHDRDLGAALADLLGVGVRGDGTRRAEHGNHVGVVLLRILRRGDRPGRLRGGLHGGGDDPQDVAAGPAVPRRTEGCRAERALTTPLPLKEWSKIGVRTTAGAVLPGGAIDASMVTDGARYFLVYRNYEALLKYNCATSYAISIGMLSDRLK